MQPIIVLFRQDLRLYDNPALHEAAKTGLPIIPLYIFDEKTSDKWSLGGASRWWLYHSLKSLEKDLNKKKGTLILKKGTVKGILEKFIEQVKPKAVYWNRCYEPYAIKRDSKIKLWLKENNISCKSFNGSLLIEPWEIMNQQGSYYKVFSAFWRNAQKQLTFPKPLQTPREMLFYQVDSVKSEKLKNWALLPEKPDWSGGLKKEWEPGSEGAKKRLNTFLDEKLGEYGRQRDVPGIEGTSKLSPYLHYGEISPRYIWHRTQERIAKMRDKEEIKQANKFLDEIGWREFSYYLLYHYPKLPNKAFVEKFTEFPWQNDQKKLIAWQKGNTGYPIVDAGMRQLWEMGWMHNRVRMIVASFLTKDLFIHWIKGEEWFWDTLVDADLASNSASWQWVAGCGADAAPYFRIFNPVTQGEKFDKDGTYIKTWIPEIAKLPEKYIHKPWEAPREELDKAGITLGKTYPNPIVDHKRQREKALLYFDRIK